LFAVIAFGFSAGRAAGDGAAEAALQIGDEIGRANRAARAIRSSQCGETFVAVLSDKGRKLRLTIKDRPH
jgi:hypothetical protein